MHRKFWIAALVTGVLALQGMQMGSHVGQKVLGTALSVLVSDAIAADQVVSSGDPLIAFDDWSVGTPAYEFLINASYNANTDIGQWRLMSTFKGSLNPATAYPLIDISYDDNAPLTNHWVVDEIGNMSWGDDAMNLERSVPALSIGNGMGPDELNIFSAVPDILLHNTGNTAETEFRVDGNFFRLRGRTLDTNPMKNLVNVSLFSPVNPLEILNNGVVAMQYGVTTSVLGLIDATPQTVWFNGGTLAIATLDVGGALRWGDGGSKPDMYSYSMLAPNGSLSVIDNGNVGFGTVAPFQAVDVERSGAAARFSVTSYTDNNGESAQYIMRRARGTSAAPTAIMDGDNIGLFSFRGHNGTTMGGSRAAITVQAAGNFSDVSTPTRMIFSVAPDGSTIPQQVMRIENGEVIILGSLNTPDYVFADDYRLMPLEELQAFIEANGHLPGVSSAAEVGEKGFNIVGTQYQVLEKVEELTLYTLQLHRQNTDQQAELAALRAENDALRSETARLDRLETLVAELLQAQDGQPVPTPMNP